MKEEKRTNATTSNEARKEQGPVPLSPEHIARIEAVIDPVIAKKKED